MRLISNNPEIILDVWILSKTSELFDEEKRDFILDSFSHEAVVFWLE